MKSIIDFTKKITSLVSYNSFYCVHWLFWDEKPHLLDLIMKYDKLGEHWLKNSENWATHMQVMPFLANTCLPWPLTLLSTPKYAKCIIRKTQCIQCYLKLGSTQWFQTCMVNPSQRKPKTYLSHMTIKTSFIAL